MASRCCCVSFACGVTPDARRPGAGTVLSKTPSPQMAAAMLAPRPQFCNLGGSPWTSSGSIIFRTQESANACGFCFIYYKEIKSVSPKGNQV